MLNLFLIACLFTSLCDGRADGRSGRARREDTGHAKILRTKRGDTGWQSKAQSHLMPNPSLVLGIVAAGERSYCLWGAVAVPAVAVPLCLLGFRIAFDVFVCLAVC